MRYALTGCTAQTLDQLLQMFRSGAAAAAHHTDLVFLHKLSQRFRKGRWFQRVHCLSIYIERQPCIGDARNRQARVFAQETDWLAHVLRPGGAIQADHIDIQPFQDRQRGADIRTQQHAPGGIQRHLRLNGQINAALGKRLVNTSDGGAHFQNVLRGLHQQHIHTALDQAQGLLAKNVCQFIVRYI